MADHPRREGAPEGSVGTVPIDAPVSRGELERALRRANLQLDSVRDDVIQLAAQVVALTDELTRRLDHVEPHPAEPGTPAPPSAGTVEVVVEESIPRLLERIRLADEHSSGRLLIDDADNKYDAVPQGPDCTAILPICQARCCTFHFALSTQDLDEGVIRWDYGKPYFIRQRVEDDYCSHNHPTQRGCTVYEHRPRPCRVYDCRKDERIWVDFDQRILAPPSPYARKEGPGPTELDLVARINARQVALAMESFSLNTNEAERKRHERAERDRDGE